MNDLDLCLEVVQGHVNHCSVNSSKTTWATDFKFGTQLCMGNAERGHKYFSLKMVHVHAVQWRTWRSKFFRWVHIADRRTLGDEWRLTGAIVCVITKRAILISAQFNFSPYYLFMVTVLLLAMSYQLLFDCRVLHTIVYCEAVRSAILATAWLLVQFRIARSL